MTEPDDLVLTTILTKRVTDLVCGFELEHGFTHDVQKIAISALAYAVATVVLSHKSHEVGRLAFDEALTTAIDRIKGYQDDKKIGQALQRQD